MSGKDACPFCGSRDIQPAVTVRDYLMRSTDRAFEVRECRACGFAFLNVDFAAADFDAFYPESYFTRPKSAASRFFREFFFRRQARMVARSAPGGRLLEIGCGCGDFLGILKETTTLSLAGIEPASRAFAEASRIPGISVFHGSLDEYPAGGQAFDIVLLRHVYEHVPDPLGAIRKIAALMKPGGRLFLWLPFYRSFEQRAFGRYWAGFDAPRHLNFFSTGCLREMLRAEGFEVRRTVHEAVPNLLALSAGNWLRDNGFGKLGGLFDDRRSATLLMLAPLSAALALCGASGQGMIEAERIQKKDAP